jgi:hypothetical protein
MQCRDACCAASATVQLPESSCRGSAFQRTAGHARCPRTRDRCAWPHAPALWGMAAVRRLAAALDHLTATIGTGSSHLM